MSEERVFEVEIRVSAHNQPDAVVHREYTSVDAASTDKAAGEILDSFRAERARRFTSVDDGK